MKGRTVSAVKSLWCTSYVQINIYGTTLGRLRERGVNVKHMLVSAFKWLQSLSSCPQGLQVHVVYVLKDQREVLANVKVAARGVAWKIEGTAVVYFKLAHREDMAKVYFLNGRTRC